VADDGPDPAPSAAARFPCPKCGADLLYDPAARGLRCPFCGEARSIEDGGTVVERDLEPALRAAAAAAEAAPASPREERRVRCDGCGATVAVPPSETAGRCAYCGSVRLVDEAPDPARLRPESVLPFAVDRAKAETLFRGWIRSLWFRPNALKRGNALADMRGVMVPFWTFDALADSEWSAMAGYHYYITVGSGKSRRTIRQTRWVPAAGRRSDAYDDLLVCASRGLDPELVRKVEPFPIGDLLAYRDEYLAGWTAETYAVDVRAAWERAEGTIRSSQVSRCAGDVPGDTHMGLTVNTALSGRKYRLALLPVWVCAYRFRGKAFRFLVNGRTGEVQGHAPLSWLKIALLVVGILAAAAAALAIGGAWS
jgi:DNA-directed RNA polymerase subunit RPC12/RpoP